MTEIYRQKVNDLNNRAKKYKSEGRLNAADLYAVLEYYGNHCLVPDCTNTDVQFDHVIPLEKQGLNARRNLQLLCESHNKSKREIDYREGRICPDDYVAKNRSDSEVSTNSRDWEPIRLEYVQGQLSLRALAKKHEVSFNTLRYHSDNEGWAKQRGEFRHKVITELSQELQSRYVDAKATAIETAHNVLASWMSPFGQPATATDAIAASKLLLLVEGEATDRLEIHRQAVEKAIKGELGQTGTAQERELTSNWLRSLAATGSDSLVA